MNAVPFATGFRMKELNFVPKIPSLSLNFFH